MPSYQTQVLESCELRRHRAADIQATNGAFDNSRASNWNFDIDLFWGGGLAANLNESSTCCLSKQKNAKARWTLWVR